MSGSPRRGGWHEVAWTDCSGSVGRTTDADVRVVAVTPVSPRAIGVAAPFQSSGALDWAIREAR